MQDEQWFAVPGLTVWQEGVPRIPYLPTRRRETLFENADVCLMALPPGLFYVQAPFFGMFTAGYATARLPLFLGALIGIAMTYWVSRRLGASEITACGAATVVALSRPLLFTGLTARPELLAVLPGWLSLIAVWQMMRSDHKKRLAFGAGLLCGLAGLFHPFAIVFAMQGFVWVIAQSGTVRERFQRSALYLVGNGLTISLWLPLIIAYPYEFRSQFFANVLDRAGPGLPLRLVYPFDSIGHHVGLLWEFAGPLQFALMVLGLVVGSIAFFRRSRLRVSERNSILVVVWSSVYLTAVVAGLHPTKGYWIYPTFWIASLAVSAIAEIGNKGQSESADESRSHQQVRSRSAMKCVLYAIVLIALMPGTGLRTTWIYLANWMNPTVYAPAFIERVLREMPDDGVFFADLSYVFDIYLSGRQTRLCQERTQYWGDDSIEYAYLVLSWEGQDANWPEQYDAVHVRRIGDSSRPQNCFVDIYIPQPADQADKSEKHRVDINE